MAQPPHSSPNHRGARSERGRVSRMGCGPSPPQWWQYNVPEPLVILGNHCDQYTHNHHLLLHRHEKGLPVVPEQHEWQCGPYGSSDYFWVAVEECKPVEEELPSTLLMELDITIVLLLPHFLFSTSILKTRKQ
ncbi:hypothetical protein Acr_22g0006740 [Actinidia rufa]|uniref:Uncharacterized protein n=1 Tax=Actinidia rufa TaxID=165716 RepID=A0A7J0GKE3_9ERIC|nr:hypothetical protein Acr_22g0006740 [Actinidia rufa]